MAFEGAQGSAVLDVPNSNSVVGGSRDDDVFAVLQASYIEKLNGEQQMG